MTVDLSTIHEEQRRQILEHLDLILATPLFANSKRYPRFLRYVVEKTLHGEGADLKERTIGVEVYGRPLDYDTAADPIVRLTAAEVRKRLAQYYQEPHGSASLRIELRPGTYHPVFIFAEEQSLAPHTQEENPPWAAEVEKDKERKQLRLFFFCFIFLILLIIATVLGIALKRRPLPPVKHNSHSVSVLFEPVLDNPLPVTFILPDLSKMYDGKGGVRPVDPSIMVYLEKDNLVNFEDSRALAVLVGYLVQNSPQDRRYSVLLSSAANFSNLQSGPVIAIGTGDNPWTLRFLQSLPYTVRQQKNSMVFSIVDRDHPTIDNGWSLNFAEPYQQVKQDYGVVARIEHSITGEPVILVAGLGQNATDTAVRLLTDPTYIHDVDALFPAEGTKQNMELVFKTQIINNKPGPPIILAHQTW